MPCSHFRLKYAFRMIKLSLGGWRLTREILSSGRVRWRAPLPRLPSRSPESLHASPPQAASAGGLLHRASAPKPRSLESSSTAPPLPRPRPPESSSTAARPSPGRDLLPPRTTAPTVRPPVGGRLTSPSPSARRRVGGSSTLPCSGCQGSPLTLLGPPHCHSA